MADGRSISMVYDCVLVRGGVQVDETARTELDKYARSKAKLPATKDGEADGGDDEDGKDGGEDGEGNDGDKTQTAEMLVLDDFAKAEDEKFVEGLKLLKKEMGPRIEMEIEAREKDAAAEKRVRPSAFRAGGVMMKGGAVTWPHGVPAAFLTWPGRSPPFVSVFYYV